MPLKFQVVRPVKMEFKATKMSGVKLVLKRGRGKTIFRVGGQM